MKGSDVTRWLFDCLGAEGAAALDIVDFMQHPGWKTLNLVTKENITFDFEATPFLGFGFCPYVEVTAQNLKNATSTEEVAQAYLDVLRTGCIPNELQLASALFHTGCLLVEDTKALRVPPSCKYLSEAKLTKTETGELSRAFELSALSAQFTKELRMPTPSPVAPDGAQISRAVHTLGNIAVHTLEEAKQHARRHLVKLTRNLLLTLKSAFTKLIQDAQEISDNCAECALDKQINANDQHYTLALIEFVIRGGHSAPDISSEFKKFFNSNKDSIRSKLSAYSL